MGNRISLKEQFDGLKNMQTTQEAKIFAQSLLDISSTDELIHEAMKTEDIRNLIQHSPNIMATLLQTVKSI